MNKYKISSEVVFNLDLEILAGSEKEALKVMDNYSRVILKNLDYSVADTQVEVLT